MKDKKRLSIICVAVLLLVAVIGMSAYTFAKYVTSTEVPSTSATVAKWGFVVSANAGDLFASDYSVNGSETLATKVDDGVAVDASSSVVAPGTTGSMTFSISGTAEVRAQVTVEATVADIVLTDGTNKYNPVKWTLTKDGEAVENCNGVTLATIKTYLDSMDATIEAGATNTLAGTYTLSWSWAFDGSADPVWENGPDGNTADTYLGWLADGSDKAKAMVPDAYESASKTTVSFSLKISVTQIQ